MKNLIKTPKLLWDIFKNNKISFFLGAICAGIFVFGLRLGVLNEGRGTYVYFMDDYLYFIIDFPLRKYGINIPFFPLWMVVGGYIFIGIKIGLQTVAKKLIEYSKKNRILAWFSGIMTDRNTTD